MSTAICYINCPMCGSEIEVSVDPFEHEMDFPENCESCGQEITEDMTLDYWADLEADATGTIIDRAIARMEDR